MLYCLVDAKLREREQKKLNHVLFSFLSSFVNKEISF